eukprot:scaffold146077_cov57-Attheya_sp.AAC.1
MVGDGGDDVVGLFLDTTRENFGAHLGLLLLCLVDHVVDLGGVLGRDVVIVLGVVLRCSEQSEDRDFVALVGGVVVE